MDYKYRGVMWNEALEAIKAEPGNLILVDQQTEEMCLIAVEAEPALLADVHVQTPAICLAAVKKNGMMLMKVIHQSEEVCTAAILNNPAAVECIRNKDLFKQLHPYAKSLSKKK